MNIHNNKQIVINTVNVVINISVVPKLFSVTAEFVPDTMTNMYTFKFVIFVINYMWCKTN